MKKKSATKKTHAEVVMPPVSHEIHYHPLHSQVAHPRLNIRVVGVFILSGFITAAVVYGCVSGIGNLKWPSRNTKTGSTTVSGMTTIDPYRLVTQIDAKDSTLMIVDLRSREAYAREHIVGAVSMPYTESHTADITHALAKYSGREIVLYGDTQYSEGPFIIAAALRDQHMAAKVLPTGWMIWRHVINFWVPEHQIDTFDISRYVTAE